MEIGGLVAGIAAAADLMKQAVSTRDEFKLADATRQLNDKLVSMSVTALALIDSNASLSVENATLKMANAKKDEALMEAKRKLADRDNYALEAVAPALFAYAYRPLHATAQARQQPYHLLCQVCFDSEAKSVLRITSNQRTGRASLTCVRDATHSVGISQETGLLLQSSMSGKPEA